MKSQTNEVSKKKKQHLRKEAVIRKLYIIEKDQKEGDALVEDWVEQVLQSKHLKIIRSLTADIFDVSYTKKERECYFHALKLLLIIDEEDAKEQLLARSDLSARLITYIKDTESSEICQDAFFIFASIFENPESFKQYFTQNFIMGLFDILNIITDDLNFKATVKILIEINSVYVDLKDNAFLKIYHIHPNSRVFDEVILRLFNTEESKSNIIKMCLCMSNIMEKEKESTFYIGDMETFIDIILLKLQSLYTEEVKVFIIDVVEKMMQFKKYYTTMYKIDEIIELFEDLSENPGQGESIKEKAAKVLEDISKGIAEIEKEKNGGTDAEDERTNDGGNEDEGNEEEIINKKPIHSELLISPKEDVKEVDS